MARKARAVARETSSDLLELRCDAPVDVMRERLAARARVGLDASDATSEIAARMAATAAPWPTATTIDTSSGREDALTAAVARGQRSVAQPSAAPSGL